MEVEEYYIYDCLLSLSNKFLMTSLTGREMLTDGYLLPTVLLNVNCGSLGLNFYVWAGDRCLIVCA